MKGLITGCIPIYPYTYIDKKTNKHMPVSIYISIYRDILGNEEMAHELVSIMCGWIWTCYSSGIDFKGCIKMVLSYMRSLMTVCDPILSPVYIYKITNQTKK
jgi:hypothetical protein